MPTAASFVNLDIVIGQVENLNPQGQAESGINTGVTLNTADTGITLSSGGVIKGGQTAFNTGNGFFLGYSGSQYKVSIGDPSGDNLTWDGADLTITADAGTISGDLTVNGNFTVNGTTTTLNTATLDVEDKNITLNYGSGDTSSTANGAGITIQDAVNSTTDASILWNGTTDAFDFSNSANITGNIAVSGTVDGRDVATDGTKLDGIEANADVTDTTNVTVAGALMDLEVTNLAQVKAFDSSDYATAAQGTTADSALQNVVEDTTPQLGGDLASNGNDILFADNDKAIFGAGDLEIYHDGSNSYIDDTGTGTLRIRGHNQIRVTDTSDNLAAIFKGSAESTLYHNNSAKLDTTSTGIDVTGTATMDGLTVDGDGSFTGNFEISGLSPKIFLNETDTTDVNTRIRNASGNLQIQTVNDSDASPTTRFGIDHSTGDISFYDTSGTTAKLFWDASEESLGIGNSSPTTALDVTGTATMDGLTVDGDGSFTGDITINRSGVLTRGIEWNRSGTIDAAIKLHDDEIVKFDNFFNNGYQFRAGASGSEQLKLKIDSDGDISFYNSAGTGQSLFWDSSAESLGIGTTSPDGELHVKGTGGGNGDVYVERTSGAKIHLQAQSATGIIGTTSNHDLAFKTNDSQRMRIDSSGNVGIGTTSPSETLHVNAGSNNDVATFESTDSNAKVNFKDSTSTSAINTNNGNMVLNCDANNEVADSFMAFRVDNDEKMRIDSSGRVGIGLTPSSSAPLTNVDAGILQVNGNMELRFGGTNVDPSGARYFNIVNTDTTLVADQPLGGLQWVGLDSTNPNSNMASITSYCSGNAGTTADLRFKIAGSEAMRITSGGILEFNNDAVISVNDTADSMYIGGGGTVPNTIQNQASALHNWQMGGGNAMRLDASGNLLVGKTSSNYTTAGAELRDHGTVGATTTSQTPFFANRTADDGALCEFYRGTGIVGSIGTYAGDLTIGDDDIGIRFDTGTGLVPWDLGATTTGGLARDAAIDIGASSARFKDFYLSGNVTHGTTPSSSAAGVFTEAAGRTTYSRGSGVGGFSHLKFTNGNGTVGTVVTSGSATTYNTSSDQRLKDNIVDAPSASDDIDAIQVRSFDWKVDGSHQKYGMVAQELNTVAPEAVSEGETEEDMMGVDYSKLVPMLVKEIQSLRARVAQLEGEN